jgi:hypothetical protein
MFAYSNNCSYLCNIKEIFNLKFYRKKMAEKKIPVKTIIKDRKGDTTEGLFLIMRKENIIPILEGKKTIEFRDNTMFYMSRFCESKTVQAVKTGKRIANFELKDIHYIRFSNYNQTWFADVAVEAVDYMALLPQNRDYFHERNCFVVDDIINDAEKKGLTAKDEETTWVFCLPIKALINTDLTDVKINIPIKNISDAKYKPLN